MSPRDATLNQRLDALLDARVLRLEPLSVGFGLTGAVATLSDGRRMAVKARSGGSDSQSNLALEGVMLADLARLSELPVPHVHVAETDLLVMDFIDNDGGPITLDVERHAAMLIGRLHATPRSAFGYERDTLIGPLHQPNPRTDSWVTFFRDHRLLHMARAARDEGALPTALHDRIERLAGALGEYLTEPPFPSLLHGDLWTGNVLVQGDRIAGFIDPAIYCGHPEIELAFATMFGTFGRAFFEAYEDSLPLEPGFHDLRRDIYNLYPTLVHVRLFGGSYLPTINGTLTRLGF